MSFTINPRTLWSALAAKYAFKLSTRPVPVVYIHHGASFAPLTLRDLDGDGIPDNEEFIWAGYQSHHMFTRNWSDIAYNFGVGMSGSVLEGRGWLRIGGATGSPDDLNSLSICAIGNFQTQHPTDDMINAIVQWIILGIELGHIAPDVEIRGHKDKPYATACPGQFLYAELPKIRSMVADGRVSTEDTMDTPLSELHKHINKSPDGTKDEVIRLWQTLLFQQDVLAFEDIDGVKGPQTRAAHKAFEETMPNNTNPNEVVGAAAWSLLLAGGPPEFIEVAPDLKPLDLAVQQLINQADKVQDEVDRLSE